jgi:hypothetical protein
MRYYITGLAESRVEVYDTSELILVVCSITKGSKLQGARTIVTHTDIGSFKTYVNMCTTLITTHYCH